ncbi:MAG: hypothetical protein KBB88_02765 [Candidatus Pacebacteria bacterium]|nr:hypothetical protein [Candidatus Paceibacterota bacterium]
MKLMQKIKNWFIPHEHNDHKPHLLREEGVAVLLVATLLVTAFSLSGKLIVDHTTLPASVESLVLVDLTNKDRAHNDLKTLALNDTLVEAATLKAQDMAEKSYFAHTSPEGVTPWHWFNEAGYNFLYAGENLAVNYEESIDVDNAWMNSPSHRANILNKNFTEIGIATAEGIYKGKKTTFVVQMFGSKKSAPSVVETVSPVPPVEKVATLTEENTDVLGETTTPDDDAVEVLFANDTYIEVKKTPEPVSSQDVVDESVVERTDTNEIQASTPETTYSNIYQRILLNSKHYGNNALFVLLCIVCITLILMIGIEIKKQHYRNILYGVLIIFVLALFLLLTNAISFRELIVL